MKAIINSAIKLLLAGIILCASGCGFLLNTDGGFLFDEETFMSEWDKWKNGTLKDYSFTMKGELPRWNFSRDIPMSEYEVTVTVKNGSMDSFEYAGQVPYSGEDGTVLEPEYTSISDMYQKIYDRAQAEKQWWQEYSGDGGIIGTRYDIRYNRELHYISFFEPLSEWKSGWIVDTTDHAVAIAGFAPADTN